MKKPTLYDIIQSTLSETGGGSWSIAVPKYVFESAIRGLVTGTNNKACKDLNQEMHNSSWFTRWDSYAPDRQLECLGFTYSRMKYMAKLKRDHFLEAGNNRLNQNSPTVRKIRNACVSLPVILLSSVIVLTRSMKPKMQDYDEILSGAMPSLSTSILHLPTLAQPYDNTRVLFTPRLIPVCSGADRLLARRCQVATPFQVIPRSRSPSAQSAQSPTGVSPTTLSNMAPLIDWYNKQRQT